MGNGGAAPTYSQQNVPNVTQMKVQEEVKEVESHEREAEDDADPFLTPFS